MYLTARYSWSTGLCIIFIAYKLLLPCALMPSLLLGSFCWSSLLGGVNISLVCSLSTFLTLEKEPFPMLLSILNSLTNLSSCGDKKRKVGEMKTSTHLINRFIQEKHPHVVWADLFPRSLTYLLNSDFDFIRKVNTPLEISCIVLSAISCSVIVEVLIGRVSFWELIWIVSLL